MARPDTATFLLTVLTGPNAGATAPLGRGPVSYTHLTLPTKA